MKIQKPELLKTILLDLPLINIIGNSWRYGRKLLRGMANEGMYETLSYESTLELLDSKGKRARFSKRKRVRYLQDNIIAYQDYAWGDGEILLNYRCTPGVAVDRYRLGYKTFVLISLQEVKNKGEVDEFNIDWDIKNGFIKDIGFWETDITHRTRQIKAQVIFPKGRIPKQLVIVESNWCRTTPLRSECTQTLPDGRVKVTWYKKNPRLYEHYLLKWRW